MAIPSRIQDRAVVISKLKQADFVTLVTDVNLQGGKRFSPDSPLFGQPVPSFWTDRSQTMKGHDYSTTRRKVEEEYTEQLAFAGDSWLLAWFFAFAMGKVTSSQPNAGSNPTCYKHVIKPLSPGTDGKDMPVTTIYVEAANAANLMRRMVACGMRDVSLSFPPNAPLAVSGNIQGSGAVTTGALASQPALAAMVPLFSNDMVFKYGTQAAPTDISSQIVPGSVRFGFTWNPDDGNSRVPGGGLYRARMWVGSPSLTLEFQRFVDDAASTPQDEFEAGTILEVKITVPGPQIGPGPETHSIEIRGLAVAPDAVKVGQQGDKTVYQYTIGQDHWQKQGGADVVTVTVQNLETSYFA